MNAGVIKNYIKINERERYEKSSIGKFSVEKNIFDLTLKENNELKVIFNLDFSYDSIFF